MKEIYNQQIRQEICKILKENNMDNPMLVFNIGLIPINTAQNWLIDYKFWQLAKKRLKYIDIYNQLSIEFDVSIRHVKYIINKKVQ